MFDITDLKQNQNKSVCHERVREGGHRWESLHKWQKSSWNVSQNVRQNPNLKAAEVILKQAKTWENEKQETVGKIEEAKERTKAWYGQAMTVDWTNN